MNGAINKYKKILKFPNVEYSYLYNQSDSFINILNENPYLRYSYNTTLVIGSSYGYSITTFPKTSQLRHTFRGNIEESGLLLGALGAFKTQLSSYIKVDGEYIFAISKPKVDKILELLLACVPFGKR